MFSMELLVRPNMGAVNLRFQSSSSTENPLVVDTNPSLRRFYHHEYTPIRALFLPPHIDLQQLDKVVQLPVDVGHALLQRILNLGV